MTRQDDRQYWDAVFRRPPQGKPAACRWLERWRGQLAATGSVLVLGCGRGAESGWLTGLGLEVHALDFSPVAMEQARRLSPETVFHLADLRKGLDFAPSSFGAVIAHLSLHYFDDATTRMLFQEIGAVLRPGGMLALRVNAVGEAALLPAGATEVEKNFYDLGTHHKRFFDRTYLLDLLAGWELLALEEVTEVPYRQVKEMWEAVARKTGLPGVQA